jgi:hypothetical protein
MGICRPANVISAQGVMLFHRQNDPIAQLPKNSFPISQNARQLA